MEFSDQTAGVESVPAAPRTTVSAATISTKVFVALPWQKHTNPMTAFCVAGLLDRRRTHTCMNFGDAFVAHSRNTCADLFLASPCDWMLTIDDDMLIPFGNANWFRAYAGSNIPDKFAGMHALDRLLSHNKTLIGGLYFGRHSKGLPMYGEGAANPKEKEFARSAPVDLIKPTRWVATGCMLIHRRVFEDIEKKYPQLARRPDGKGGQWFTSSEADLLNGLEDIRDMMAAGPMSGEKALKAYSQIESLAKKCRSNSTLGMGEDVTLCVRAAAAGHQAYVDFGLVCGHIGHQVWGPWNAAR
jgi:hypothetical protein